MNKEELIITDKFENLLDDGGIDQLYLNLYSANSNDPNKNKLLMLFAFLHNRLNSLLFSFNYRVSGNHHYLADESRYLILIINNSFDLLKELMGTKYEFRLDKKYYLYLKKIIPILSNSGGTEIPNDIRPISLTKYEKVFRFLKDENQYIEVEARVDETLPRISTRNATFLEMEVDEKIESLNKFIENKLKIGKKYIDLDCETLFKGLITNDSIREYRNVTNCFRHGSEETINDRANLSEDEKVFLINYGLTICNVICKIT